MLTTKVYEKAAYNWIFVLTNSIEKLNDLIKLDSRFALNLLLPHKITALKERIRTEALESEERIRELRDQLGSLQGSLRFSVGEREEMELALERKKVVVIVLWRCGLA